MTNPLSAPVLAWYAEHARDLPWRRPEASPWGVVVSEFMLQQTPVARVEPVWREWMQRWPRPADLAAEPVGEAIRAWGRLGYPRRAIRLHATATALTDTHGGQVPSDLDELLELPGVGRYTAAAIAAFAYRTRTPVLDTNVRRVLARQLDGLDQPATHTRAEEWTRAQRLLPETPEQAATWNVAVMELGALVCTARRAHCDRCPITGTCRWLSDGRPRSETPRRVQAWHGTDRQCRGRQLQAVRARHPVPVSAEELLGLAQDVDQARRCLHSLVQDGLLQPALDTDDYRLPRH